MKRLRVVAFLLAAMFWAATARAAIATGTGESPELWLVLWDPVNKVSYTRDLGLPAYVGSDPALRAQSFWVQAQQDAGYQQFWTLDTALDANYQQFRSVATDAANIVWAVIGTDGGAGRDAAPGVLTAFLTLRATSTPGTPGDAYSKLSGMSSGDFGVQVQNTGIGFVDGQLNRGTLSPFNSHRPPDDYARNGSGLFGQR